MAAKNTLYRSRFLNQLKLHVNSYLQENDPQEQLQINLDTILFHQTTKRLHRNKITHLIMAAKYTLYRSRFQTQNIYPLRFHTLNMVLRLVKTVNLEKEQQLFCYLLERMKAQIHLS